jgi:hypothetical protein
MELKQAGYIVGTVAYEAVETALLVAIEAGLAAATVGTAGGATPATAGGTAAIVAAKAAAFSKLVNRLSERADLLDFPKIAKAIDRLNEMVVWMIKYPMCFVAGTKVHTLSGLKNIEDIQRDDWVLTRDEHNPTSENRYRRVTELFQTSPSRLLTIAYRNEVTGVQESLTCTGEHPFFVSGREELSRKTGSGHAHLDAETALLTQPKVTATKLRHGSFIPADGLEVGDTLVLADGHEATIISIDEQSAAEGEAFTTFNFAVDGDHTYFVGESGVWVHNTGNPCDEAFDTFAKMVRNGSHYTEAYTEALRGILKYDDGPALIKKHAADLDNFITKGFARALKNDYGNDISEEFAEFIGKRKWLADDANPMHWSQLDEAFRKRGMGLRSPKGVPYSSSDRAGQLIGAVHEHHLLPEDGFFTSQWTRLEIDIEDFKIAIDAITHTGEGVGIHSSTWRQDWNARWRTFFQRSPGASRSQVFEFARELAKEFAID